MTACATLTRSFPAALIGIAIGIFGIWVTHYTIARIDAKQPAVEYKITGFVRHGDAVELNLSGKQLRSNCTFAGMQAFVLVQDRRFPANLTWVTPSADISRKTIGEWYDLGVWRVQPAPVGAKIGIEETNVCGLAVVNDSSPLVAP